MCRSNGSRHIAWPLQLTVATGTIWAESHSGHALYGILSFCNVGGFPFRASSARAPGARQILSF